MQILRSLADPSGYSVCAGGSATDLSVSASGTGTLHYQWYSNTSNSNSGGSAVGTDAASYTPDVSTAGTYYFYVTVSGDCSSATSNTAEVIVSNSFTWTGTNGTSWTDAGNWGCGIVPGPTNDVIIPGSLSNYPIIDNSTTASIHNLTINGTGSVIVNGLIKIGGSIDNSGTFDVTSGTIELDGDLFQNIPPSGCNGNINTLIINNPAGVSLGECKTIGTLTLTNGIFDIGNSTLIATTINSGSSSSYVKTSGTGVLKMIIGNSSLTNFPVGNSTYDPVSITNNSGATDSFDVRVADEVYINGSNGTVLTQPRVQRTWNINKSTSNAGSGVDFLFNWNNGETTGGLITPMLFHYDGTQSRWIKQNGTTSYPNSTSLNYTGYTGSFSPFAIVDAQFTLPLTWLSFTAQKQDSSILLNWSTASELNTLDFIVQHSTDGIVWNNIGTVPAAVNSNSTLNYNFIDVAPVSGANYYRLIQRDIDGHSSYSKVLVVVYSIPLKPIIVYPNPVNEGLLYIKLQQATIVNFYNSLGIQVMSKNLNSGIQQIDVSRLAHGMYVLKAGNQVLQIIIQ